MVRGFSCLLFVLVFNYQATARQSDLTQLVAKARQSLCRQDTSSAIDVLAQAAAQYPDEAMILSVYKVLADLYINRNQLDMAQQALMAGLRLRPHQGTSISDTLYCRAAPYINYSYRSRADLCVGMSDIYKRTGKPDSSYYYLLMADNLIASYSNEKNAIEAYRGKLSILISDYFTAVDDTVAAINCLLDNFLKQEVNSADITGKLRALLLTRYSVLQIRENVGHAINNIRIKRKGDGKYILRITLFDHVIEQWGSGQAGLHKKKIRLHPSLNQLRNSTGTL